LLRVFRRELMMAWVLAAGLGALSVIRTLLLTPYILLRKYRPTVLDCT